MNKSPKFPVKNCNRQAQFFRVDLVLGGTMNFIVYARRRLHEWLNREENTTMEIDKNDSRKIRQRYRKAAEPLYENSSLRDELDDEQAQKLLDWGSRYLKKMANETAELDEEQAETIMETRAEQVSGVMRQVNRLTRAVTSGEQQELSEHLSALRRKMDALGKPSSLSDTVLEQKLTSGELDREQLFKSLMSMLDEEE